MWLKSYLNFGPDRPTWAYFADKLIQDKATATIQVEESMQMNIFLQSWNASKIPAGLVGMMNAARDFGLRLEAIAVTRETIREMPIWMHSEAERRSRRLHHSGQSECLRDLHHVKTVGEAQDLADKRETPNHKPNARCRCQSCREIRQETGCVCPWKCYRRARELIDCLPPKWNPYSRIPEDYEYMPEISNEDKEEGIRLFDPRVTAKPGLKNAFRIFTEGPICNDLPDTELIPEDKSILEVAYTDGSCLQNGSAEAKAGAGSWFGDGDARNKATRIPSSIPQNNNTAEMIGSQNA
ncbi:hypothetical protein CYLTODRAFT_472864, partial [Cylindrobasidium torrendii FP15055 ss-10]